MPTTYIIGHQKPDTDSVTSAMALEYLYKNEECFGYKNPVALIADPVNSETQYLLDKFDLQAPPLVSSVDIKEDDQVVLVDHNEASQRIEKINQDQIVEIVDHHKANLNLSHPIYLTFKTWGSTASIVYYMMQHHASKPLSPESNLAGLILAAILSDTVGLKSPTTCDRDKEFAQQLAKIANIDDLDEFSLEIFKAKSNISHLSPAQIVKNDYKIFDFKQPTFIGQVETVNQDQVLEEKDELIKAMLQTKKEEKVECIFLAVTDILRINTKLVLPTSVEQQIAEQAFGGKTQDHVLDIGPKLSRKKEIAPAIEEAIKNNK